MVLQIVAQTYINFKYQKEEEIAGPPKHAPAAGSEREAECPCKAELVLPSRALHICENSGKKG